MSLSSTLSHTLRVAALTAIAIGALARVTPVHAQLPINPDKALGIFQDGRLVGEIYRDDPDPERYVEHWVYYPGYRDGVTTTIVPGVKSYRGLDGFLANVPFEPGAKYIVADCLDGTTLPR